MLRFNSICRRCGMVLLLTASLGGLSLDASAQPPKKDKDKGPKGPAAEVETLTVRGTVQEFTTAPKGEIDGFILSDGTQVHWPPHLADRFKALIVKGDRVRVVGRMADGPKGDAKLEVSSVTNLKTNRTRETDESLPAPREAKGKKGAPAKGELQTVNGSVKEFTTAPKGEVDGLVLSDGTVVHWPPHLANRFSDFVVKGDKVRVTGFVDGGPKDDGKLEVATLTNLRTKKTVENPDRPAHASKNPRGESGGNREERIKALEDQVEQMSREIQRLRKEK